MIVRVNRLLDEFQLKPFNENQMQYVEEICRYGAIEFHTTASLVGAVASQEVIKLITHQYVPIDNTLIFNGITGEGSVFSL